MSGLHQKFLLYCEVERRLSPQTVTSYRSDFRQFTEFLRGQSRWGLVSQDVLGALSTANVRDYQYYMAEQGWSTATVQRRLVSLNRFGVWLVKRGHAKTNPLAEIFRDRGRHDSSFPRRRRIEARYFSALSEQWATEDAPAPWVANQ